MQKPEALPGIAWCSPPAKLTACGVSPRQTASAAATDWPAISAEAEWIAGKDQLSSVPSPCRGSDRSGWAAACLTASTYSRVCTSRRVESPAGGADRTVTPGPPFSPRASTRRMVRASRVGSIGWPGPKS